MTYNVKMNSIAGEISFNTTSKIVKVGDSYKIKWTSSDIFPDLLDNEKIRVESIYSKRGTIFDRDSHTLAKDGNAYSIGIIPSKMDETTNIKKLSQLLDIKESTINEKINSEGKASNTFVQLKKISKDNQELKNEVLKIKGVMVTDTNVRIYPYKESISSLLGYVQNEDGIDGIEKIFNNSLKGQDGSKIYIEDENQNIKKVIKQKDKKDGNDIKLTIDINLQQKLYNELKDDNGLSVSINYKTGEILALVSTKSYDNNIFSLGITDDEWKKMQEDESRPLYAKYLSTYVPGSTFKPIIAAIGLESSSFTKDDDFGKSNLKWQKDSSWGNFYVTTLENYEGTSNLENALVYSDNIYFAKAALKIGKENLEKYLNKFYFNKNLDIDLLVKNSEYGTLDSEKEIANTGYGQAKVLVNPILMASLYSMFANEGNMIKPYIEYEDDESSKNKYLQNNVISQETANIIKEDLRKVVEDGTAKSCNIEGRKIYRKNWNR